MKVHIHTPSYFPSLVGMTYAAHVHATLLRELGADVTVVAPGHDMADVDSVPYRVRRFDVSGSGLPWSRLGGDISGLLEFTAAERPDVLIVEGWFTTAAALLSRLRPSCGHAVISSHGSADLRLRSATLAQAYRTLSYRWIEPREQRRVTAVVSAAILLSLYRDEDRFRDGVMFARNHVPIYVCPNPSTYSPRKVPVDDRIRNTLLHVGSLTPLKNQLLAVRTLAALPPSLRLTFAFPSWNAYGDLIMDTARGLGVLDRVSFVEGKTRDELELTFDASGLLLMTSLTEAQPIIAADALRKGIPFVSTRVGCMSEFSGGIVTAPSSLPDAIMRICRDEMTYTCYASEAVSYYDRALHHRHSRSALAAMLERLNRA